jgi:CDP-diacylglycerol--glycerol-3-phosphate 3-phosphatidyltransferase
MLDRAFAWTILAWVAAVAALFSFRLLTKGRTRYDRIDKIGGSVLLSQRAMEAAYWSFQPIVRACVGLGITANMLTWGSLVTGVAAGFALAFGHFGIGAFLGLVGMLCDTLDGLVARATKKSSDTGEVLDAAVDRYTEFFYMGGLAYYYRLDAKSMALALAALLGALMISYSSAKADALQVPAPKGAMRRHERAAFLVFGAVGATFTDAWELSRFDHRVGVPMLAALGLIGAVGNVSAVRRFAAIASAVKAQAARAAAGSVSLTQVAPVAHAAELAVDSDRAGDLGVVAPRPAEEAPAR